MRDVVQELQDSYADGEWNPFLEVIEEHPVSKVTEVEEVLEKLDADEWVRQDVVVCMKELDDLGLGRFFKGAKGKRSRIEWYFSPSIIAKAARGDGQELREILAESITQQQASGSKTYRGKDTWSFSEVLDLLSESTGIPATRIRLVMTIPEARKALAESQCIPQEDVMIRLG